MEQLEKILAGTSSLFKKYGIKSITMDDISRELGISKKTLYLFVEDKKDLVKKTMINHLNTSEKKCGEIFGSIEHPIDQLLKIGEYYYNEMKETNPSLIYDLKKFYSESWEIFQQHRNSFIRNNVHENLLSGIKKGVFRDDLNPEITSRFYICLIDMILDQDIFPGTQYKFTDLHNELIIYHIRGISTLKGLNYLTDKLYFNN